jgi:hypothetical protein
MLYLHAAARHAQRARVVRNYPADALRVVWRRSARVEGGAMRAAVITGVERAFRARN